MGFRPADAALSHDAEGAQDIADALFNPSPDTASDVDTTAAGDGPFNYPLGTLVGHWLLDDSESMALDSSPYGNHGVLEAFSANPWTSGRVGGSLAFDPTRADSGVRVDLSPSIRDITVYSIAAWTYRATNTGLQASLLSRQVVGTNFESINLTFDGPDLVLYMYPEQPGNTIEARYAITGGFGRWVHVAATFDGAAIRLYVDGTRRLSQVYTGRPVPSDQPLYVGTNKNNSLYHQVFDGRLDDVRLYAEVLSASAIAALASP